jgi:hypothetical protein
MDFIERIFGISPDGGSGALELALLLALLLIVAAAMVLRRRYGTVNLTLVLALSSVQVWSGPRIVNSLALPRKRWKNGLYSVKLTVASD